MAELDNKEDSYSLIPKPADWLTQLVSLQSEIIYNCILAVTSPIYSLASIASDSYHEAEDTANATVETAVHKVPSKITHGGTVLAKRIGVGLVSALQVCMMLLALMVAATVMGVGLVEMWVEEPLVVRERLYFDYTKVNPEAVYVSGGGGDALLMAFGKSSKRSKPIGVPVGHNFHVSLALLMPESDYNRDIGIFQLTAELLSNKGEVIAKSSQPCMLQFRSLPVRLARTFLSGIPCLLGLSDETQRLNVRILKHKELGYQKTEVIRVILSPRAGTSYLPQIYEAEILLKSQLPWLKEFVYNWKWTFYVWSSLYIYIILVIGLVCCSKTLFFPTTMGDNNLRELRRDEQVEYLRDTGKDSLSEEMIMRRWKQKSRRKRKAEASILHEDEDDDRAATAASSASSTKVRTSAVVEDDDDDQEDVGDSESVCN